MYEMSGVTNHEGQLVKLIQTQDIFTDKMLNSMYNTWIYQYLHSV